MSCKKKENDASVDINAPTFSSAISFSSKTSSSFTINWAGTDNVTAAADLSYKVVYSASNNITTFADAEANGTILADWTINSLTANMSSLPQSTLYYVTVLVRDTSGLTGVSAGSTSTLCSGKIIFLTSVPNANFGGAAGADAICNANKPTGFAGSTFKAMLTDVSTRRACYSVGNDNCSASAVGRLDWVFSNNQTICTSDYSARVGTTNGFALLSVPTANVLSSSATLTYTGFNVAWGSSASNCSNFASTAGTGIVGSANGVTGGANTFISSSIPSCNGAGTIYCVEQ